MATDTLKILIEAQDRASSALSGVAGKLGALAAAYLSWAAVQKIVQVGIDQIQQAVAAASQQEQADLRLALALKNLGDASAVTLEKVKAYAGALQRTTLFTDDQIQGAQTLLVSLGRLSGEGLDRATLATLDLAQGLNIDLAAAAQMVAKAAVGSTVMFGKLGLQFDENATKAEKLSAVLKFIENQFGGSAKDAADSYAGSIQDVAEQFGEAQEAFGKAITSSPVVAAGLKAIADELARFAEALASGDLERQIGDIAESFIVLAEGAVKAARAFAVIPSLMPVGPGAEIAKALQELDAAIDRIQKRISNSRTTGTWEEEVFGPEPAPKLHAIAGGLDDIGKKVFTLAGYWKQFSELTDDDKAFQAIFGGGKFISGNLDLEKGMGGLVVILKDVTTMSAEAAAHWAELARNNGTFLTQSVAIGEQLESEILPATDRWAEAFDGVGRQIAENVAQGVANLGGQIVYAALSGERAFGRMFAEFAKQMAAAIVQALILRAIMTAIGFYGPANTGGQVQGANAGGQILRAAGGVQVPGPRVGYDMVPALLTPGEVVLRTPVVEAIERTLLRGTSHEQGGSGSFTVVNNFASFIDRKMVEDFVRKQNEYAEHLGLRVVATEVIA